MPVKAPFNFVPLGEKVYFPQWADLVSHDIPFEDYKSGYIDVTVTAETPLFIRNGHGRNGVDNTFSHIIDENNIKKYFIPASTMKGAIRNVLKILSFGKMQIDPNLNITQGNNTGRPLNAVKEHTNSNDTQWNNPDLAEVMFGYTNETSSLKGRIQFSHFWKDENETKTQKYTLILSSPKVSYYPIYIKQENGGDDGIITQNQSYNTHTNGVISGWKRYILRNRAFENNLKDNNQDTELKAIQSGEFNGRISFHNLKEIELGALISAITFHGHDSSCFHQIGEGKPYGLGKVKVIINNVFV